MRLCMGRRGLDMPFRVSDLIHVYPVYLHSSVRSHDSDPFLCIVLK